MSKPVNDEEIRKKIGEFEQKLPNNKRNPKPKETVDKLIERASKPVPSASEKRKRDDNYTDTQTRQRTAEDTSAKPSDGSQK